MGFSRALVALLTYGSIARAAYDVFDYVDPLIGTTNGGNYFPTLIWVLETNYSRIRVNDAQGHVFAGATLPFGLAKAVADSVNDNAGGYASDGGPSKFYYQTKTWAIRVKATKKASYLTMML